MDANLDYYAMFDELDNAYTVLTVQQDELELKRAKIRQALFATYQLLSEEQKAKFAERIKEIERDCPGPKDAILMILNAHKGRWFTPPVLLAYMRAIGLGQDLGVNPLSVVGATVKRLVPEQVETQTLENGRVAYRILRPATPQPEKGTEPVKQDESVT